MKGRISDFKYLWLGHRNGFQNLGDHVLAGERFSFRFVSDIHAMSEHVHGNGFYIFRGYVPTSLKKGQGFAGGFQIDGGPWRGAVFNVGFSGQGRIFQVLLWRKRG